jgi:hypothetical protein
MAPILGIYASQISGHLWAPSGAYDSIATTTLGAGGANDVTFSSIPQTYTHLQVRVILQGTTAFNVPFLGSTINGDNGSNYATHRLFGDGSSATSQGNVSQTQMIFPRFPDTATPSYTNMFGAMIIDYLDYSSGTKNPTVRVFGGYDANGSGQINLNSGVRLNTAAITSLTFQTLGMAQYSSFALYGIKGN